MARLGYVISLLVLAAAVSARRDVFDQRARSHEVVNTVSQLETYVQRTWPSAQRFVEAVAPDSNGVDFTGIVDKELDSRKPDLNDTCWDCVEDVSIQACKTAWKEFMKVCDSTETQKIKDYCEECKEAPEKFLLEKVLRATVNPIDAGYQYCWWHSKCKSENVASLVDVMSVEASSQRTWPSTQEVLGVLALNKGVDFTGIVDKELNSRKPNLEDTCWDCVEDVSVQACKTAWKEFMKVCDSTKTEKIKNYCKESKKSPEKFLLDKVLRATVNPIDAGYQYCWWHGKCKSKKPASLQEVVLGALASGNGVDFTGIVDKELDSRKPDLEDICRDCIEDVAIQASKTAWKEFMKVCDSTETQKIKDYCEECKEAPEKFLLEKVLRAAVNPIDAGYHYCWWHGKCKSKAVTSLTDTLSHMTHLPGALSHHVNAARLRAEDVVLEAAL